MIENVIDVVSKLPPSTGDDLLGFVIDAEHFFGACPVLASVEVEHSSVRASLVEIRAEVATHVETLQALSHALQRVWMSIAYQHFQACAVQLHADATVLRFATVISGDAFFVSGTLRVAGVHYPELAKRYARDFAELTTLARSSA